MDLLLCFLNLSAFFRGKMFPYFNQNIATMHAFFLITGAFFSFKLFLLKLNFTPNKCARVKSSYARTIHYFVYRFSIRQSQI